MNRRTVLVAAVASLAALVAAAVLVGTGVVHLGRLGSRDVESTPSADGPDPASPSTLEGRPAAVAPAAAAPGSPTSPPSKAAAAGRLLGDVLRPDGAPAAAATVSLFAHAVAFADGALHEGAERDVTTTTDAGGHFAFEGLAAGRYSLEARLAGVGTGFSPALRVTERGDTTVAIRLTAEAAIAGRVVTEDGKPVVSAKVSTNAAGPLAEAYRRLDQQWFRGWSPMEATTDEHGRFRLAPLAPGNHTLNASAPGHVPRQVSWVAAPARDLTIVLREAGSLRAIVSVGSATPPAEIRVWTTPGSPDVVGSAERKQAPVGTETPIALEGLARGRYLVHASAKGWTEARADVTVVAGQEAGPIRLTLAVGTSVHGRVLEKDTGRALGGARVYLDSIERHAGSASSQREETLETDTNGRWQATLRPGEWRAEVTLAGYVSAAGDDFDANTFQVTGEPLEHDLLLVAAPAIVGRVETLDGSPVVGATVRVASAGPNDAAKQGGSISLGGDGQEGDTDKDGRFHIEGVVVYAKYGLEVTTRDGARATLDGVVFQEGKNEAEVRIRVADEGRARGRVDGRIVDESGNAVPGALVRLSGRGATTDAEGRFSIERVAAGRHRASFVAVGYAVTFAPAIDMLADETVRAPDWTLRRTGLVVEGRVTDPAGKPVDEAEVWTMFPAGDAVGSHVAGETGADGRYRLEGPAIEPAEIAITFRARGFDIVNRNATPSPCATLDVVLEARGTVASRIDFRGPAPSAVHVEREYPLEGDFNGWLPVEARFDAATGNLELEGVPSGRRRLRVTAPGFAPVELPDIEVRPREKTSMPAFAMTPGGTLAGRILDAKGKPLAAVQVGFERWFLFTDTDADGRFRIEHAPPGVWTLFVAMHEIDGRDPKDYPKFSATVEEGKTSEIEQRVK